MSNSQRDKFLNHLQGEMQNYSHSFQDILEIPKVIQLQGARRITLGFSGMKKSVCLPCLKARPQS